MHVRTGGARQCRGFRAPRDASTARPRAPVQLLADAPAVLRQAVQAHVTPAVVHTPAAAVHQRGTGAGGQRGRLRGGCQAWKRWSKLVAARTCMGGCMHAQVWGGGGRMDGWMPAWRHEVCRCQALHMALFHHWCTLWAAHHQHRRAQPLLQGQSLIAGAKRTLRINQCQCHTAVGIWVVHGYVHAHKLATTRRWCLRGRRCIHLGAAPGDRCVCKQAAAGHHQHRCRQACVRASPANTGRGEGGGCPCLK